MTTPGDKDLTVLADVVDGHAERFVPGLMAGMLIDAEHRGRYWWAASVVTGKRVLDAACGIGYGANILASAGASEVVGVDHAAHVIEAAREEAEPRVTFEVADLLNLPFANDAFDVVVCFEGIEHVAAPYTALDEIERVLMPAGVLAISSPNRSVYVQGNPHHRHEFVPDELDSELRKRFEHVRLVRQHGWLAAAILEDAAFEAGDGTAVDSAAVRKIAPAELGAETYTLALASNDVLPTTRPVVVLTQDMQIRHLIEQSAAAEEAQRVIARLEAETRRAAHAAQEEHERVEAITRTKTFRYTWALATAYAHLKRLTRGSP
jgi:SAM-dependent methyltransferase